MKKNRRTYITLGLLSMIVFSLLNAAQWFQATWDKIDFATVVYQLSTPLNGTNSDVIVDFCIQVIPKTIIEMLGALGIYYIVITMFRRMYIEFSIKVLSKEIIIHFGEKFVPKAKVIFGVVFVSISGMAVYGKILELGIDKYVASLKDKSTIFEEYYVLPNEEKIVFPEKKRNLICIYLESMETTYASTEAGGGKPYNYIPELTDLAEEYVNISNADEFGGGYSCALTGWTMAALLSSTSGVPYKIPGGGNEAGRYAEMLPGLVTMGDILKEQGYKNYFLCGSEIEFGGRDIYFSQHGAYELMDYKYAKEKGLVDDYVFWGYDDRKLYEIAKNELTQIASTGENFNFSMLTVDTHQPYGYRCELCDNQYEEQYANAIACASRQAYEFVRWIQEQEWYSDTTVVLVGDHNSMVADFWDDIGDFERRTYNCFVNLPESVDASNVKNREFTTLDLFPTMLAAMDVKIEGNKLGLGVNLFSQEQTLMEIMGKEKLNEELSKYSDYYITRFTE